VLLLPIASKQFTANINWLSNFSETHHNTKKVEEAEVLQHASAGHGGLPPRPTVCAVIKRRTIILLCAVIKIRTHYASYYLYILES
jgi:hypothetical protein